MKDFDPFKVLQERESMQVQFCNSPSFHIAIRQLALIKNDFSEGVVQIVSDLCNIIEDQTKELTWIKLNQPARKPSSQS